MPDMLDCMTEDIQDTDDKPARIRLIIDTEEAIRAAVRLRALKTGMDNSAVVTEILRSALADEISEVETYPQFGGTGKKPKKRRPPSP